MAKIESTKKQVEALKSVTKGLEEIRQINGILFGQGMINISRAGSEKKAYSVELADSYKDHVIKLLEKQKKALVKEIKGKTKANSIILSEEETSLLTIESSDYSLDSQDSVIE